MKNDYYSYKSIAHLHNRAAETQFLRSTKEDRQFYLLFHYGLSSEKIDWSGALDVITECLLGAWGCVNVRDMEISVDIASGQYAVRFTSATDMRDLAYAALVLWETNGKRYDNYSVNFENYSIFAEPIELDDEDITATP